MNMKENHLLAILRSGSSDRDDALFAEVAGSGEQFSYGAFWDRAGQMAAALRRVGAEPGDRVAAQVEKSVDALALYLGAVAAGCVFLPLNTAYTEAELAYFLGDAEPAVFVCDPDRLATLEAGARKAGAGVVMTLDDRRGGTLAEAAEAETPAPPVVRGPDDLAAILYTSGTTGRSKGAMLTHRNLASNAAALAELWGFTPSDRLIHALPVFHTHGLFVATNVAIFSGCGLLFHTRFDAGAVLAEMPRATVLMGVPTFYVRLLEREGLASAARGVRLFVSGSAPMLVETHRRWRAVTGHTVLERYGMTETNMNASNPLDGERRPGSVGPPLPGVELIVTEPDTGRPLPTGETGAIEVRGPNVFRGYWRMPEKTAEELRPNGFFATGDLGRIDEDGYLHIVGRSKDMIISGGYNVYPKEIEALIDAVPGVVESAVVGLPHPDFGEAVAAAVVPDRDDPADASRIASVLEVRLARYKQPKQLVFVDALPRNAMGKVQKAVLRERMEDTFAGG